MPGRKVGNSGCSIDTESMVATLGAMAREAPGIRRRALKRGAHAILAEASVEGVIPYDTGTLAESKTIDDADPDTLVVGYNTDYAAAVHERHKTKPRWFLTTLIAQGPRIMRAALEEALAHALKQASRRDSQGRFKKGGAS